MDDCVTFYGLVLQSDELSLKASVVNLYLHFNKLDLQQWVEQELVYPIY